MKKQKYFRTYNVTDLKDLLYKSAKLYKRKTAFVLKNEEGKIYKISYKNFKEDVEALGTMLIDMGLSKKPIAVIGKNSYSWAVAYLASTIVGIVVPIDKELHHTDVINFLNISNSEAIIGDYKYIKSIKEIYNNKNLKYISMNEKESQDNIYNMQSLITQGKDKILNGNNSFFNIKIDPDELRILLFTSGTTGNAKGVCLSHGNICSNIMSVASVVKVSSLVRVLSILPLHHTYECTLGFLLIIYGGGSISYCEGLRYINKNIVEFKPSFILCVPLLLENVHKKIMKKLEESLPKKYFKPNTHIMDNLPFFMKPIVKHKIKKSLGGRLRTFIVGAAAINPDIVTSFYKFGINVLQGYGLTECSPLVAGNNDSNWKADSAGLPIPNVEYKIDNPNEDGIGEIIVKGPNVMLGYYNNEEETNKVIKGGWFHTGDLGKIDENKFLYITGRCKTVIVTKNGKNIYPEEIEYYLNESPLISEAMIVGVQSESNDDTFVKAQIFPDLEAMKDHLNRIPTTEEIKAMVSDIIQKINSKLPNYKHIKGFFIRDKEFEKTTTKKIKRYGDNVKL